MDAEALIAALREAIPGVELESAASIDSHATAYVRAADLLSLSRVLRDGDGLKFDFLAELTAVDFLPRAPRFEVVYTLVSLQYLHRIRLKVRLDANAARVPTMSGVWPAATWLEREVWDLFGIEFEGHPDPRRLLMPEDWEGYPLRKDYPVQVKLAPRTTEPLQVTEEEFRANLTKDRLSRDQA